MCANVKKRSRQVSAHTHYSTTTFPFPEPFRTLISESEYLSEFMQFQVLNGEEQTLMAGKSGSIHTFF